MWKRLSKKSKQEEIQGKVIIFPNKEHPHILLDGIYVGPQNNIREVLKKYEDCIVRISIEVIEE